MTPAEQLAEQVQAVCDERWGPGVMSVGVADTEVMVYAPKFVGQVRRVVTQRFPGKPVHVFRVEFLPTEVR